jgi:hypothetical protein
MNIGVGLQRRSRGQAIDLPGRRTTFRNPIRCFWIRPATRSLNCRREPARPDDVRRDIEAPAIQRAIARSCFPSMPLDRDC